MLQVRVVKIIFSPPLPLSSFLNNNITLQYQPSLHEKRKKRLASDTTAVHVIAMGVNVSKSNDSLTNSLKSDESLSPRAFPRTSGETITLDTNPPRKVGYALYGDRTATSGRILLFFHGTPGTRLFFTREHGEYAESIGMLVVVPERPGFGLSDGMEGRTLMDGADDAREVLDRLGCGEVYVMGYSAGGPYALAFAYKYGGRCLSVGVVSGLSPNVRGVMKGMSVSSRMGYLLAGYAPRALRWVLRGMVEQARREIMEGSLSEFSEAENQWFRRNEGVRRMFIECVMELYARERGVTAEAEDYALMAGNWGFEVEQLEGRVLLYGGGRDYKCTVGMFRELERGCREGKAHVVVAKLVEEEDHLMFYRMFESIVSDMIGNVSGT